MNITSTRAILEAIQQRAIEKWGEKGWVEKLAQEYVKIAQQMGDTEATYSGRRRHIRRVFETWGCNLETAIALAAAVDCRFQMACTNIEVKTF